MKALVCEKSSFKDKDGKTVYLVVLASKDKDGNVRVSRKANAEGKYVLIKNEVVPEDIFDKVYPCKCYEFKMGLNEGSRYAHIIDAVAIPTI